MMLRIIVMAAICCMSLVAPSLAQQQPGVALVVGNGAYLGGASLRNPVNDAKAISTKLSAIGFRVTTLLDANRDQLQAALEFLKLASTDSDTAVLFYAGHGITLNGVPYMIPIDANVESELFAKNSSLSLPSAINEFMLSRRKIIFFDASLDKPYRSDPRDLPREAGESHLIRHTSSGALISYAAEVGFTPMDGDGKNSPFTSALVEHIGEQEDIAFILRRVRDTVTKATNSQQRPWFSDALIGGTMVLAGAEKKVDGDVSGKCLRRPCCRGGAQVKRSRGPRPI